MAEPEQVRLARQTVSRVRDSLDPLELGLRRPAVGRDPARPAGRLPGDPVGETAKWSEGGQNINLVGGVTLDHQGERLTNPRGDKSWVAVGSILILRSAYTTISVTLKNSWDDGILVSDYDWRTNTYADDSAPPGIVIRDGFSFHCGCGGHSIIDTPGGAGRNGGAIDVADTRGFIVSDW